MKRKLLQFAAALGLFAAAAAIAADLSYPTLVPQDTDTELTLRNRQALAIAQIAAGFPTLSTTTVKSTALEASHVLSASAAGLVSLHVYNSKASAQYILIMDSATVPSNGAVVLLYPPILMPATSNASLTFPSPLAAANGISVCNSSTGSFTKTVGSADCIFTAQVR